MALLLHHVSLPSELKSEVDAQDEPPMDPGNRSNVPTVVKNRAFD